MTPRPSGRLTKVCSGFPGPHLAGNMEGAGFAELASTVLIETAWPDVLGLFSKGVGDTLLALRKAANEGDGQAGRILEAMLECELGKGVSVLFQSRQNVGLVPVF